MPELAIETVRGRLSEETVAGVLAFWATHTAVSSEEAQRRVFDVVCVVRDAEGAIAGVCSVYDTEIPLIAGRRFWVFRSLLPGPAADRRAELIHACFDALATEFDEQPGSPIGLCVLLSGEVAAERPEALWPELRMIYAGHLQDGRQVRVAYFPRASIARSAIHA